MSANLQVEGTYKTEPGILDDPKRLEHVIDQGFSTIISLSTKLEDFSGRLEELSKKFAVETYFHFGDTGLSDGTEINVTIPGPAAGMHWLIDRISFQATGAGITEFNVYKISEQAYNLVENLGAPGMVKQIIRESPPIYIPPENNVVIMALAGAGISLSVNFQARRISRAR
jgi:hypothetical protein